MVGSTTVLVNAAATTASKALPPARSMSAPASEMTGCPEERSPCMARNLLRRAPGCHRFGGGVSSVRGCYHYLTT